MDNNKDILSVSNSILLSGVLIALSIFLNGVGNKESSKQKSDSGGGVVVQKIEIEKRADQAEEGSGKVIIYEFSDFQCPFCQQFWQEIYPQLKKDFIDTGKVTFVYRQFPIVSIHTYAQKAAEASECANDQGKFWQYHDELFSKGGPNGAGLSLLNLKKYASEIGLNTTQFDACLDGGGKARAIGEDMEVGERVGITGTPTFFINGKKYIGSMPYNKFKQAIEEALAEL